MSKKKKCKIQISGTASGKSADGPKKKDDSNTEEKD